LQPSFGLRRVQSRLIADCETAEDFVFGQRVPVEGSELFGGGLLGDDG
jgi:hypothetical protein